MRTTTIGLMTPAAAIATASASHTNNGHPESIESVEEEEGPSGTPPPESESLEEKVKKVGPQKRKVRLRVLM